MIYFARFPCGIVKIGVAEAPSYRVRHGFGPRYRQLGRAQLLGTLGKPHQRNDYRAEHWIQRLWQHIRVEHLSPADARVCEFFYGESTLLEWIGAVVRSASEAA